MQKDMCVDFTCKQGKCFVEITLGDFVFDLGEINNTHSLYDRLVVEGDDYRLPSFENEPILKDFAVNVFHNTCWWGSIIELTKSGCWYRISGHRTDGNVSEWHIHECGTIG